MSKSGEGIELKEITVTKDGGAPKDSRSFRPNTIAEINAAAGYQPLVMTMGGKTWNVGCGNSVEDIGIITTCYVTLWSFLVALYSLLLKAVLDTDDQSTALYTFCFFGVIFVVMVAGAVYTGQLEEARLKKARAYRRAEALKAEGADAEEVEQ
mmetsp:Transcript_13815/g.27545  ORF Transcript_13815/g.27545 Transcript_13815/m.27545 type:complete len:153 (+) Transcript_13815:119-577(+)|eukprot:CAMPEP_0182464516 /NCGR_PEP_ID=MMETSP1319-20130603/8684_1 /TAXON_ID=172717 /ORGANISM="Bolidomonas pacifica, Strain RCC208" /LENGTH=152 /DNA_ID=CAMNT_0024664163 /DNA_START=125 /DNA_END=583 /DNA_ORIENTATION=+